MTIAKRKTTGIGSLPHPSIDAALAYSFKMGIPFLPQIPICNPGEFMIAQALEGLPGLQAEKNGTVNVDLNIWASRTKIFEPSEALSSSWQAFLEKLSEQKSPIAKIQIAGPFTAQWSLNSGNLEQPLHFNSQIHRLILARSLAMIRGLQQNGIQPIIYIDEPALYTFSIEDPRHILALQDLKFFIHSLRKTGAQVGLHCCGSTTWEALIGSGKSELQILSIDSKLSLRGLLNAPNQVLETFIQSGGTLSLGIIPTAQPSALHSLRVEDLFEELLDTLNHAWKNQPALIKKALKEAIYTPACGLALHSISDAEFILEILDEFYDYSASVLTNRNPA